MKYPHLVSMEFQTFVIHSKIRKRTKLCHSFVYDSLCFTSRLYTKLIKHVSYLLFQIGKSLIKPSVFIDHNVHVFAQNLFRHQYR